MGNPDLKLQQLTPGRAKSLSAGLLEYQEAIRLSRQAQALADPMRVVLLALLRDAGKLCVSDLSLIVGQEQSGVSRNLRILWENGLLEKDRWKQWVEYEISPTGERVLAALLADE